MSRATPPSQKAALSAPSREASDQRPPQRFAFVLVPDFSILAFTSALEPLRAANRLTGQTFYTWALLSGDGAPVHSSSQVGIMVDAALADDQRFDTVIVCAGLGAETARDLRLEGWLRRLARQGCRIGSVSTGTYILARAGLLQDVRCTIHWESLPAFEEAFPDLEATAELFEIDGLRMTCSGGTASLDMMLSVIGLDLGRELATKAAEQFIHERIRSREDKQRMALRARLAVSHPKLLAVIAIMEEHIEDPLPRTDLARMAGLSTRQLERLFRRYLGKTPTRHYLELRLDRARLLLAQTSMSVLEVATACGFVSASHFSKCYREFYNRSPRDDRAATPMRATPAAIA
ncbi:GlxA family transcriptional regulator [Algihabitans albus]|uniref:GlxA family transcriptional regulator n=1 Tax=Algihabitans albus TaxID=2164067 RepID=UPI000E5D8773|nr:GlxA family transcriptional regulator [Algihabitans albus]